jgi:mRNA interferase RelE/StbE
VFEVLVEKKVQKRLRRIQPKHVAQLRRRLRELQVNPRPHDSENLVNLEGYRLDQGEYRVLYTIDFDQKLVRVYRIIHRSEGCSRFSGDD